MPYKFSQLTVNLIGGGAFPDRTCDATGGPVGPTVGPTNGDGYFLGLQLGTLLTLGLTAQIPQSGSLASLAALKEQLQRQLEAVEKQQATTEKGMRPQSVEEVDALADKLNGALKELKARRVELAKQPKAAVKKRAAKKTAATQTK